MVLNTAERHSQFADKIFSLQLKPIWQKTQNDALMKTKDLIKEVRALELITKKNVTELFAGNYKSSFKGKGIEFLEVREYIEGDDIRDIDWNVTAREGRPYIKVYTETRELTTILLIDGSGSMATGSRKMTKKDLLLRFCATIALSALKNNDRIGLIIFTDKIEKYVPPKKGRKHVLRVLRDITEHDFHGKKTDYEHALRYFSKMVKQRTLCFFASDFLEKADSFSSTIKAIRSRHDLITITLKDKMDCSIAPLGLISFEDPETGERIVVNAKIKKLVSAYEKHQKELFDENTTLLRRHKIDSLEINTHEDLYHALFLFFKKRQIRMNM